MVKTSSGNFFKSKKQTNKKKTTVLKAKHIDSHADEKKDKKTVGGCL